MIITFVALVNRDYVRESFSTIGPSKLCKIKVSCAIVFVSVLGHLPFVRWLNWRVRITFIVIISIASVIAQMLKWMFVQPEVGRGILFPWARQDKTGQDRGHRQHRFHTKRDTGDTGAHGTQGPQVPQETPGHRGNRGYGPLNINGRCLYYCLITVSCFPGIDCAES